VGPQAEYVQSSTAHLLKAESYEITVRSKMQGFCKKKGGGCKQARTFGKVVGQLVGAGGDIKPTIPASKDEHECDQTGQVVVTVEHKPTTMNTPRNQ
jgi:hypothetical protein